MAEYNRMLVGAHVFLLREGKVYLIRRANTGFRDGFYSVPAGHVDEGETVLNAVVREAKEEAGVVVNEKDLIFAHVVHTRKVTHTKPDRMQIFFSVEKWLGKPKNMEPEKCDDAGWFPLSNLPANMVPYVRQAIEKYQTGDAFSELDD